METKEVKYRLLLRPFSIGTYPTEGFLRYESEPDFGGYGRVVMNRELPLRDWNRFDLLPLTQIEALKGKIFDDESGYYSKIELSWYQNDRGVYVHMYDLEGKLVEKPFGLSTIDVFKNLESGIWKVKETLPEKRYRETTCEKCSYKFSVKISLNEKVTDCPNCGKEVILTNEK